MKRREPEPESHFQCSTRWGWGEMGVLRSPLHTPKRMAHFSPHNRHQCSLLSFCADAWNTLKAQQKSICLDRSFLHLLLKQADVHLFPFPPFQNTFNTKGNSSFSRGLESKKWNKCDMVVKMCAKTSCL